MGRAPCCDKSNVKRGPWSPEEDSILKNYLHKYGTGGNWISLPQRAGLKRCGKSCRLRWLNYLRPDIKHGAFSEEENNVIISMYYKMGSRWSIIAANLQGRTDNDVKNHWNTKLKKKLFGGSSSNNINNKFNPTIMNPNKINNNNNVVTFTNNHTINPTYIDNNHSNPYDNITNQINYDQNPSFPDLFTLYSTTNPMSLAPKLSNLHNIDRDPFAYPNSTRYAFNPTLMTPQASLSVTNAENVNVCPHEEVSSASGSSSVIYGPGFEDDPFLAELGFGVMLNNNPDCNFVVDQEDVKVQGLAN